MSNDFGSDSPAGDTETYVTQFEPGDSPSESIVSAISSLTNESPVDLSPLYDAIEPDALDALFEHGQQTDHPDEQRLTFAYAGFEVTVTGDGTVELTPTAEAADWD